MAGRWLLLQLAALLLSTAAAAPQVQTVRASPGSSVRVHCEDSSAPGGGGWNLLDMLSSLLLGDDYDDDDDDDDDDDVDDVTASSTEQRAGSEEDDYGWWELGLLDDWSSEEAARRGRPLPQEPHNSSLADEAHYSSLTRRRRATAAWDLGAYSKANIDVQGGKNWSVRVFDWVLVRRSPSTGQVEVKLNMPGFFSPAGGGGGGGIDDDVDYAGGGGSQREATSADSEAGGADSLPEGGQPAAS